MNCKCKHHQTTSVHLYSLRASQWYKGTTKSNIFAHDVWEISTWQKNNTIKTNKLPSSNKTMKTNKLPSLDILSYSWKVVNFKGQSKFSNAFNTCPTLFRRRLLLDLINVSCSIFKKNLTNILKWKKSICSSHHFVF